MNPFNHHRALRWTTTLTQIGNPTKPIDAGSGRVSSHRLWSLIDAIGLREKKPSDVVSTLVSIYYSKDLFAKEFQVLLAQCLLAVAGGNYQKEVKPTLPPVARHFSLITQIAQELGDSQDSLWRSAAAGLRGNAQGLDGLQANRLACAVSKFSEWQSTNSISALGTKCHAVRDPPNYHFSALLAAVSIVQDSNARPTARVCRPLIRLSLPLGSHNKLNTAFKRPTRAS